MSPVNRGQDVDPTVGMHSHDKADRGGKEATEQIQTRREWRRSADRIEQRQRRPRRCAPQHPRHQPDGGSDRHARCHDERPAVGRFETRRVGGRGTNTVVGQSQRNEQHGRDREQTGLLDRTKTACGEEQGAPQRYPGNPCRTTRGAAQHITGDPAEVGRRFSHGLIHPPDG